MPDILRLDPDGLDAWLDDLVALLQDAVDDGASVGFLSPLAPDRAAEYWRARAAEASDGARIVFVAVEHGRAIGSVQLAFAAQENAVHRAEVQRLIVHRLARRRGVATELMLALEAAARDAGRTLIVLNTRAGDPPERFYERLGYTVIGVIPDYARNPDGSLNSTSVLFRHLSPRDPSI